MFDKIVDIVMENQSKLSREEITRDTDFYLDLGWTSMDMVNCVMLLEDLLGRQIPDEQLGALHTVGDLLSLLEG